MDIKKEALNIQQDIIKWRRDLHKIPETGLLLPLTSSYIKKELEKMDIKYTTYENHSGIVCIIGDENKGSCIGIRADIDGLSIKEEIESEFKSQNNNMHACGHDAHTAILLGTAKLLKKYENSLNGCVKLIFQPGEEGPGGAYPMVLDGVLESPKIEKIFSLHVGSLAGKEKNGSITVNYKNTFAADDQLYIKITGKGGHGSMPHQTVDSVAIAGNVITSLQNIVSREVSPHNSAVVTIASIFSSNDTYNVIPEYVELKGTVRTLNYETRDFVFDRIRKIVDSTVTGFRGEYELDFRDGYPPLINSKEVTTEFVNSAKKIVDKCDIHIMENSLMGGEDAAFFFEKVPGSYFFLNTPSEHDGILYPAHNSKFKIDETYLYLGSALFTQVVIDLIG